MSLPATSPMSYRDYLALEAAMDVKHEYLAGAVYAMAGGTAEHSALAMKLGRLLGNMLDGKPCVVFGSDTKLRIEARDVTTYPDLSVVCGPREFSPVDPLAVTNPKVIVEVTSPSSDGYDRGEKFDFYRAIPSLLTYVVVAHDREAIDVFERVEGAWKLQFAHRGERASINCLGVSISVDEVYADPVGGSLVRPSKRG